MGLKGIVLAYLCERREIQVLKDNNLLYSTRYLAENYVTFVERLLTSNICWIS